MPRFSYAFQGYDEARHVRASMREKDFSHKHAREIGRAIKGMGVEKARDYLTRVSNLESAVPMRRFNKQVGHRSDPGVMAGRYPQKAARQFILLLDNLEANAEFKGMDLERLRIINVTTHKGTVIKRFIPRAQGRSSANNNARVHAEMVAAEV